MKLEVNLSESEHRYLLEANSHDKKLRSLASFARHCLLDGLDRVAAKDLGQRAKAVSALVGNTKRRNP